MFTTHKYTLLGIAAISLWSCLVGMIRNVAEQLGAVAGAASIYSCATLFLILVMGIPRVRRFSLSYLLIGGVLFASYEVCFSLALGFANDRQQTLEMAIINYLWPSLTVLISVLTSSHKVSRWVYPALGLAFMGVAWSILGDEGLSIARLIHNIASNPLAYSLAFIGAIIWAVYCNITRRLANGQNAIALFFFFTACTLWVHYLMIGAPSVNASPKALAELAITGICMGSGYALWNNAIIRGNMLLLATLSYFTPVFSSFSAMLILGISLPLTFWQGVFMVTLGSLLCWWVTRSR